MSVVLKRKNPLDDIFRNNEAATEALKKRQDQDKAWEVEAERKSTVIDMSRLRVKKCRARYAEETKRVHGRVRHLTDREIRREYGIMAKPYKTHTENILWAILEKGPISVKEISQEIGEPVPTVSSTLSRLYKRLGGPAGVLDSDMEAKPRTWKALRQMSVEAAYRMYLDQPHTQAEDVEETEPKAGQPQEPAAPVLPEPSSRLGIPENINIHVKFTWEGQIKVLFGLLKE